MSGRTLVLLRHAKAEPAESVPDVQRPLAPRGGADAEAAGAWLAHRGLRPEVVLCSPATRTRQTWHAVAIGLTTGDAEASGPEVHYHPELYYGGADQLLDLVRALPDQVGKVLVVGHNPTVSNASALLWPEAPADTVGGLKTCGIAVHRLTAGWAKCGPRAAELVERHTARG